MNKRKIINDPVYDGFLTIDDPVIHYVIEHPFFQRLRRIKQLGLADLVYPGAVHTRFSHSLGALNLMGRALEVLKEKGVEITDEECQGAKLAILLHDIGHGPFSHALEKLIVNAPHEEISLAFMEYFNREIEQKGLGSLKLTIDIFKNEYHKHFLHQLISSQLDVDRLDYLGRDSYFTGVREGIVGTDRIISMLNVHNDELVVDEKGIYSVEKFIISRRLMYWQVYMHKTVIAADILLRNIFKQCIEYGSDFDWGGCRPLVGFLTSNVGHTARNLKDDSDLLMEFATIDDTMIYGFLQHYVAPHHHGYRPLLEYLINSLLNRNLPVIRLSDKPFSDEDVEEKCRWVSANIRDIMRLHPSADLSFWEDWMTKYMVGTGELHNRSYDFSDHEIKVLCKNGCCLPIGEVSDQLDHRFLEKQVTKYYFYSPRM